MREYIIGSINQLTDERDAYLDAYYKADYERDELREEVKRLKLIIKEMKDAKGKARVQSSRRKK